MTNRCIEWAHQLSYGGWDCSRNRNRQVFVELAWFDSSLFLVCALVTQWLKTEFI